MEVPRSTATPVSPVLPDPATPIGARVARRLREERIIWLTATAADGTPQPNPVGYLWDGASFLVYCRPDAKRLEHIRRNPRVALHFESDGHEGDIVVFTGTARIATGEPPADQNRAYMEKYQDRIKEIFGTPKEFAAQYSEPVRITPERVRGF
jgi:PPOX class probable F420-dependent enzyme